MSTKSASERTEEQRAEMFRAIAGFFEKLADLANEARLGLQAERTK